MSRRSQRIEFTLRGRGRQFRFSEFRLWGHSDRILVTFQVVSVLLQIKMEKRSHLFSLHSILNIIIQINIVRYSTSFYKWSWWLWWRGNGEDYVMSEISWWWWSLRWWWMSWSCRLFWEQNFYFSSNSMRSTQNTKKVWLFFLLFFSSNFYIRNTQYVRYTIYDIYKIFIIYIPIIFIIYYICTIIYYIYFMKLKKEPARSERLDFSSTLCRLYVWHIYPKVS